ncbi:hypothetical protein BKA67DRAFT_553361 [Truncatella angustata]|uniref:Uncharacterized protein n=1 Tax=Truncatella angustata TaxID=152316 RepID=A0A9P8URD0_9PEZI|nr:uncharacterized protein BKA67DRAFT_553361 [Truncatella angustata]KAH6656843.1 hypothetical protein BKA67DRAFT_553361 [Truncatella angustata]
MSQAAGLFESLGMRLNCTSFIVHLQLLYLLTFSWSWSFIKSIGLALLVQISYLTSKTNGSKSFNCKK